MLLLLFFLSNCLKPTPLCDFKFQIWKIECFKIRIKKTNKQTLSKMFGEIPGVRVGPLQSLFVVQMVDTRCKWRIKFARRRRRLKRTNNSFSISTCVRYETCLPYNWHFRRCIFSAMWPVMCWRPLKANQTKHAPVKIRTFQISNSQLTPACSPCGAILNSVSP